MKIEVIITDRRISSARASVSVDAAFGGFTIKNILVRELNGKAKLTMPLSQTLHPVITLRGDLKQQVQAIIWEAFCMELNNNQKTILMTEIKE